MITSSQIIRLSEEWFKSIYIRGNVNVPIFKNPSSSDYLELKKSKVNEVRFVADNNSRNLYIGDAVTLIHDEIGQASGIDTRSNKFDEKKLVLMGIAALRNGKFVMTESDDLFFSFDLLYRQGEKDWRGVDLKKKVLSLVNNDWSWCDKYVQVSSYMNLRKHEIEKLIKN